MESNLAKIKMFENSVEIIPLSEKNLLTYLQFIRPIWRDQKTG